MAKDFFDDWQPDRKQTQSENKQNGPGKSVPPALKRPIQRQQSVGHEINYNVGGSDGSFISVWKNVIGLIISPKKAMEAIRGQQKISWLVSSVFISFFVYIFVYLYSQWQIVIASVSSSLLLGDPPGFFEILGNILGGLLEALGAGNFLIVISAAAFFIVMFVMMYVLGNWVVMTFSIHFWAVIFHIRKPWWTIGVFNFYMQVIAFMVNLVLVLVGMLIIYFEPEFLKNLGASLKDDQWALVVMVMIIPTAVLIWYLFLYILAVRIIYNATLKQALLTVLVPIIIFFVIIASLFAWILSVRKTLDDELNGMPLLSPYGALAPSMYGASLPSSSRTPSPINVPRRPGMDIDLPDTNKESMDDFEEFMKEFDSRQPAVNKNSLPMDKKREMSSELLDEMGTKKNLSLKDYSRISDLLDLKYRLDYYYAQKGDYPKASTEIKLDGEKDVLNKTLEEFYTTDFRGKKDSESPKYYYAYASDGKSYTLTCYLTGPKEVYKLTNE